MADLTPGSLQHHGDHKYLHIQEDNTMPQVVEPTSADDEPEAQRAVLRLALNDIVAEVETALRDAQLDFPVYVAISNSGKSLAMMSCPLDPSDTQWSKATAIVCRIIGARLGNVRLRGRALHCPVANGTIAATDVTADTEIGE
jgi:hypothetical protein